MSTTFCSVSISSLRNHVQLPYTIATEFKEQRHVSLIHSMMNPILTNTLGSTTHHKPNNKQYQTNNHINCKNNTNLVTPHQLQELYQLQELTLCCLQVLCSLMSSATRSKQKKHIYNTM
ncbi:hypothetical protein Hanom_Chr08g00723761 [Helianthus anomalus]